MSVFKRRVFGFVAGMLVVGCGGSMLAQDKTDIPDGSLAALTSEVRRLRVAVEESTRSQTQTQALGVYLSAQQSRMIQLGSRLDAARKELSDVTIRSTELASQLEEMQAEILRTTEPQRRAQLQDAHQGLSFEQKRIALQEQQARSREAELSQASRLEEARWADLINRLEQLIQKPTEQTQPN